MTLGSNTYYGITTVNGGTLKFGDFSDSSIPNLSAVFMSGTATIDLNGSADNVSFVKLTGGTGDTITNSSNDYAILNIGTTGFGSLTSVFSGTIENGTGGIKVTAEATRLDLSQGHADYTGTNPLVAGVSTLLDGSVIILNPAQCSTEMLESDIQIQTASTVLFDAPSGNWTFSGKIEKGSVSAYGYLFVQKTSREH